MNKKVKTGILILGAIGIVVGWYYVDNEYNIRKDNQAVKEMILESSIKKEFPNLKEEEIITLDKNIGKDNIDFIIKDIAIVDRFIVMDIIYRSDITGSDRFNYSDGKYFEIGEVNLNIEGKSIEAVEFQNSMYSKKSLETLGYKGKISDYEIVEKKLLIFKLSDELLEGENLKASLKATKFTFAGNKINGNNSFDLEFEIENKSKLNEKSMKIPKKYTLEKDGFEFITYTEGKHISSIDVKYKDSVEDILNFEIIIDVGGDASRGSSVNKEKKVKTYYYKTSESPFLFIDIIDKNKPYSEIEIKKVNLK